MSSADVRRNLDLRQWRQVHGTCEENTFPRSRSMDVEQRYLMTLKLQSPLRDMNADSLKEDEVISQNRVCTVPTHEKVMRKIVVSQLHLHAADNQDR